MPCAPASPWRSASRWPSRPSSSPRSIFKATDLTPEEFTAEDHGIANLISSPDAFTVIVALCAGAAGMLSLSTAKSGALIGVLISVTTIPAAANIGVAAAYGDRDGWTGSLAQLALNLVSIVVAGTLVLAVQRMLYAPPALSASRAMTRRRPSCAPSRPPRR